MPVTPAHVDAANDALAGSFPSGAKVHLYTIVNDPTVGPDPSDELTSDGGYAPATLPAFDPSVDGVAHVDVSFGTSTDAYSDEALAYAITTSSGVVLWWDNLPERLNVSAAGIPVVTGVDIYPNLGDM